MPESSSPENKKLQKKRLKVVFRSKVSKSSLSDTFKVSLNLFTVPWEIKTWRFAKIMQFLVSTQRPVGAFLWAPKLKEFRSHTRLAKNCGTMIDQPWLRLCFGVHATLISVQKQYMLTISKPENGWVTKLWTATWWFVLQSQEGNDKQSNCSVCVSLGTHSRGSLSGLIFTPADNHERDIQGLLSGVVWGSCRGGLGRKFRPGTLCPDEPTTLLADST